MSRVPGLTKIQKKKKKKRESIKPTSGKRRHAQEIRRQKEKQTAKKGSRPQRGCPVLQDNQQRSTPHPPHRWEGQS